MQECVKNLRSYSAYYIYLHIKPSGQPDYNNLQYYCNDVHKSDYVIPVVSVDKRLHTKSLWGPNPFQ